MATEQKSHAAVDRAEEAIHASAERAARAAHEAVEGLTEYGARAKEQVRETGERVRETGRIATERSRELIDQVTDYVTEHPMTAIGIAVAVGFVLGAMARRGASSSAAEEST